MRRAKPLLLLLIAITLVAGSVRAQDPSATKSSPSDSSQNESTPQDKTTPPDDQPSSPDDAEKPDISMQRVQEAQDAIEKDSSLESSVKDLLRPRFQQATASLDSAAEFKSLADQYRSAIDTGPDATARLKSELESLPTVDSVKQKVAATTAGLDSAATQLEIDTQQTALKGFRDALAQTSAERARTIERRTANNARLPKAESELAETRKKLASPDMAADPTSAGRTTERLVLEAAESRLQNELEMLKQEQASQLIRENLLEAQENLLIRQVENATEVLKLLEAAKDKSLLSEAQTIHAEIEALIASLPKEDASALRLAKNVQELALEFDDVVQDRKLVSETRDDVAVRLERLNNEYEYIGQQIELGGSGEVIASLLFEMRNRIVRRGDNSDLTKDLPELDSARLAEVQVNQQVRNKEDFESQFAEDTSDDVRRLCAVRFDLLERLGGQYKRLITGLSVIKRDNDRFADKATEVSKYIDDQLFWIQSFPEISASTVTELPKGIAWIFRNEHWQQISQALTETATGAPIRFFGILISVVLLVFFRHWIIRSLEACGEKTKLISTDDYSLTTKALLLTILLAAPFPLMFVLLGWTLGDATQASETGNWLRGIALSSLEAIWLTFLLGFMVAASRPKGLGIAHFGWREKPTLQFRAETIGFAAVYVPALFVTSSTIFGGAYAANVGRVSFIIAHAWTAFLLWQFFASSDGSLATRLQTHRDNWFKKTRYLWCFLLFASPIVLIVLAAMGYIITAFKLSVALLATLGIIAIGNILFWMALRWYLIKRRKLALSEALERRRIRLQAAAEENQQEPEEVVSVNPEDEVQLDLDSISSQTRHLLKMVFSLSTIVAVAFFWSEYIPLFSVLEQFRFPLTDMTLLSLSKAILIVVVTWIAVKNLPGLLELSVLRTMPIDAGTRYAIARVSQYAATAVGLVLLFGILKVDWSKLGWIAAALSVGLGFGLQEVVANFVCGLILLFEQPVRVGDVVTLNNMTGTVTKIQMRATTITNWDRQEIIVPNKNLITGTILNWTLSAAVNRVVIPVGVAYGTDTEKARQILLEVATEHPLVMEDPGPSTSFEQFSDSSLTIILRAYLPNLDNRLKTITELHTEIDKRFTAENIQIAFPQLDLHFREGGSQEPLAESISMRDVH